MQSTASVASDLPHLIACCRLGRRHSDHPTVPVQLIPIRELHEGWVAFASQVNANAAASDGSESAEQYATVSTLTAGPIVVILFAYILTFSTIAMVALK
jgi:hypothetical protein